MPTESPIVAFRYKDDSPAHVCSGRGYTNTTRCGQNVNWDRIHYLNYGYNSVQPDEILFVISHYVRLFLDFYLLE